jgi:hypothetical protein
MMQGALMPIANPAPMPAPAYQLPDTASLLFAAWALGTLLMALYVIRLQIRFHTAAQRGEAGPAVLGFFRPRIVMPDRFQNHFTARERAAILAHEQVHLARQDARINALVALLRCFCWFNPLIHLGARWLRMDQELACDATAVAGAVSRRDYARALLKTQVAVTALPMGCNWPGSQHPLVERIALLKRRPPGPVRRLTGVSLVLLAATSMGLGAWAAQPAVAANAVATPSPRMVLSAFPAAIATPAQTSTAVPPQASVAALIPTAVEIAAQPTSSGHDSATPGNVHADSAPAPVQMAASTQTPVEAAGPTENVTVTGSRNAYHDFTQTFATPTIFTGKMARWERRVCPVVAGEKPNINRFIAQRVQYVAQAVGAPVRIGESCKPNIDIVFTTTPQALLDTVAKDDQHYLGYFDSVAQKKALTKVARPIQAWYATETTDIDGRPRLDTGRSVVGGGTVGNMTSVVTGGDTLSNAPGTTITDAPPFFHSLGTHTNDGIHTGFFHILIVVDSTKLAGQDLVPLADYIAMLALTQINSQDACQALPSIVNRMAAGCKHAEDGLTMYDLAYLNGLYHMTTGRMMIMQRGEIGDLMTDQLASRK